jgi:EAL domain-containing protein (putative c-di-GMP-specific phosphodiesterase class I)
MAQQPASATLDPNTGCILLASAIGRVEEMLQRHNYVGVLLVDGSSLLRIERDSGTEAYDSVLQQISQCLGNLHGDVIRDDDLVTVTGPYGEQFAIFLGEKRRAGPLKDADLEIVADRVYSYLAPTVFEIARRYLRDVPRIFVGYSFAVNNPKLRPVRVVPRILEEARDMARNQARRFGVKNRERIKNLLVNEEIKTVYQPIVRMTDRHVIGYEALSRGPVDTEFHNPSILFQLAKESDLLFELDRVCRRLAIENAVNLPPGKIVFVNTLPNTMNDPDFQGTKFKEWLEKINLEPERIVLEITEEQAAEGLDQLRQTLDQYRMQGCSVAIDDAGTGYSNLEAIMKLEPTYLKIDMSLVRGIEASVVKQELIKALSGMARSIKAQVIAEGIETPAEYQTLLDLGVEFGQGYLFARPGAPFPELIALPV